MDKTKLLNLLIKKATKFAAEDGKEGPNTDYVVLAALDAYGKLSTELKDMDGDEVDDMLDCLNERFDDKAQAYRNLRRKLKKIGGEFSEADIYYGVLDSSAEIEAEDYELREIPAALYLRLIFNDMSEVLKECGAKEIADDESDDDQKAEVKTDDEKAEEAKKAPTFTVKAPPVAPADMRAFADKKAKEIKEADEGKRADKYSLSDSIEKIHALQTSILENVYGQDQAVSTFISGFFQSEISALAGTKNKPRATFLFAGPPGVGKTFLAEQIAEAIGLPFRRFDMSEYCNKESDVEFVGSDNVYKNGKAGNVTSYVDHNPKCVLLFDEIEKAHATVIHLFLQILDAGRIRDNFTDREVSFENAILIFTTNAGKTLYEDEEITNLSAISRKQVLSALGADKNPTTGEPLFPAAIRSRFAAGNVVMFNRLCAHDLLRIVEKEISRFSNAFDTKAGVEVKFDQRVLYSLMYAEGSGVDARMMRGRASGFFCQENYELLRLLKSKGVNIDKLKRVNIEVNLPDDEKITSLFVPDGKSSVLVFGEGEIVEECKKRLTNVNAFYANEVEKATEILHREDIGMILCDITCGLRNPEIKVLNLEDVDSSGRDFFVKVTATEAKPVFVLSLNEKDISAEEYLSFIRAGARGSLCVRSESSDFAAVIDAQCTALFQQSKLIELGKANRVLSFATSQTLSEDGATATIQLYDYKMALAPDIFDSDGIVDDVSRPKVRFDDVIGAEDAKGELKYFVEYLKNPVEFMRRGVRAPKGILLYGPPGTGKTMLAKAMAGESDVTYIATEGNSFIKKYIGEGSAAVHEVFRKARKYAPSVLFIDEIDAIAKNRGSEGSSSVVGDILTAFLTEMDGFKSQPDRPVFVLAATNFEVEQGRARSLDAAILRRFDRKVLVDLPTRPEREQYIRMKAKKHSTVTLSDEQIENIAMRSTDMSLADLESVFELALRNSIKSKDYKVDDKCFDEAFETFNGGEIKKWDASGLQRTARHEAGHALVNWLAGEKPSYLTIVSRGNHGGYMQHSDDEGKGVYIKSELLSLIRASLGGRAAEMVYYGAENGVSTGAASDLYKATKLCERMICEFGMDEKLGLSVIDAKMLGGAYYPIIRDRINEILSAELNTAIKQIEDNRQAIDALVDALVKKNQLRENEIDEILSKTANK